jgi:hypothetical protein
MTDMITNEKPPQYKIELLLPWHAAGTLNSRDADEVEKTLAQDKELTRPFAMVREEMNETILLNETLGAPSARVMENLFKTIDKERKGVRSRVASGLGAWHKDLFTPRVLESRVLIYSASAAAVIIGGSGRRRQVRDDLRRGEASAIEAKTGGGFVTNWLNFAADGDVLNGVRCGVCDMGWKPEGIEGLGGCRKGVTPGHPSLNIRLSELLR